MSKRKAVSFAGDASNDGVNADDAMEMAYAEAVQSIDKRQRVVRKDTRFKVELILVIIDSTTTNAPHNI